MARAGVEPTGGRLCGELALAGARMRTLRYKATTRSARWIHCLFSKWVRAKAKISAQKETSEEVSFCALARSRTWSTGTANRYFIH